MRQHHIDRAIGVAARKMLAWPKIGADETYWEAMEAEPAGTRRVAQYRGAIKDSDIDVSYDASSVVSQLWPTAQKIIFESVRLVTPLLKLFGVVSEEMSPFCRDFASCRDLLETYVSYCPKTFSYKGFSGGGNNENSDDTELAETAGGHSHQQDVSNIIARFEHFTIDPMAGVTSPDDSEDGDELINVIFDKNDSSSSCALLASKKLVHFLQKYLKCYLKFLVLFH